VYETSKPKAFRQGEFGEDHVDRKHRPARVHCDTSLLVMALSQAPGFDSRIAFGAGPELNLPARLFGVRR
jgi:hypothetical protein